MDRIQISKTVKYVIHPPDNPNKTIVNPSKKMLGGIIGYVYPLLDPDLTQE